MRAEVIETEICAEEAFELRTERLLARIEDRKRRRPTRRRSYWQ
jgi:hypothetical protein